MLIHQFSYKDDIKNILFLGDIDTYIKESIKIINALNFVDFFLDIKVT